MTTYSDEEAKQATTEYFYGDELAADVWVSKYALRNEDGKLLEKTPSTMHRRLAREFARIEGNYPNPLSEDDIYGLLSDWTVVPQGSPMAGIGNTYKLQTLSNCYVIEPTGDSFGHLLKTDEEQCQIMKRRGGVGHDISNIRPKGAVTKNAAKTTDGIGAFMERFSNSCRTTAQGGRRGALMLTIACNHYEIETFIDIKRDKTKVTGANISIRLSDEFMQAVEDDRDFILQWPVDVPAAEAKMKRTVKARDIWNKIISSAHDNAEPGLLFWDTVLKRGPADAYKKFKSSSTNPCAELPLPAHESCRLLLINLTKFVNNPFKKSAKFDYDRFSSVVRKAQRLMDDLVDLEIECIDRVLAKIDSDPEPDEIKARERNLWTKIREMADLARRTGLGVTGVGDCLAMLSLKYGNESVDTVENIYKELCLSAYHSSVDMAKERGPFKAFDLNVEKSHPFIEQIMNEDPELRSKYEQYGRRNIALLTTAPAGSVSILTQTTSGIEPVFRTSYTRRKKINANDVESRVDFVDALGDKWQHYEVYHHGVKRWMNTTSKTDVKLSPYAGATAEELSWQERIAVQAAAQKWICHSLSSTINLPKDTSVDVVKEIYMSGWKAGLKGVTVYVDGCRDGVLVTKQEENKPNGHIVDTHAPKRLKELECDIHRVSIKGESYIVLVGLLKNRPYEVFAGLSNKINIPKRFSKGVLTKNGKINGLSTYKLLIADKNHEDDPLELHDVVGTFDNPVHGSLTRTISLSLRHGVPVQFIAEQLKKDKHSDMTSFSNVIARVLSKSYITDGAKPAAEKTCPSCSNDKLRYQEGCITCDSCGFSKC